MPSSLPTAPKLKRAATTTRSRSSSCSRPMGRRPGCCPVSTQATRTSRSGSATWGSARRKPATSAWRNFQRCAVSSGCPSSETATSRRRRRCANTRTRRRTSVASKRNHADNRELDHIRSGSLFCAHHFFFFTRTPGFSHVKLMYPQPAKTDGSTDHGGDRHQNNR